MCTRIYITTLTICRTLRISTYGFSKKVTKSLDLISQGQSKVISRRSKDHFDWNKKHYITKSRETVNITFLLWIKRMQTKHTLNLFKHFSNNNTICYCSPTWSIFADCFNKYLDNISLLYFGTFLQCKFSTRKLEGEEKKIKKIILEI